MTTENANRRTRQRACQRAGDIPNHELPQAALDHMNEFFPPQHPDDRPTSRTITDFDTWRAPRANLQMHKSDWLVI